MLATVEQFGADMAKFGIDFGLRELAGETFCGWVQTPVELVTAAERRRQPRDRRPQQREQPSGRPPGGWLHTRRSTGDGAAPWTTHVETEARIVR